MSEEKLTGDIPLRDAMIAWTPLYYGEDGDAGYVNVRSYPDSLRKGKCWHRYGDEFVGFKGNSLVKPLSLLINAWHIALRGELEIKHLHKELCRIPEYRDLLADDIKSDPEEAA